MLYKYTVNQNTEQINSINAFMCRKIISISINYWLLNYAVKGSRIKRVQFVPQYVIVSCEWNASN